MQKQKPVKNSAELLLKITEKIADFENGEILAQDIDMVVKASNAICNLAKTQYLSNQLTGVKASFDFFTSSMKQIENAK